MRLAWILASALLMTSPMSGCFGFSNEAYDTLTNIRETRGDEVFTTTIDHFGEYGHDEEPRSGSSTFFVEASDTGLGIVIYLALWFDEGLTITIYDAQGTEVFTGSYGDEYPDERTIAAALEGEPGTWTLEWQSSGALFKPQKIDILAPDANDRKTITKNIVEDRHHHFLRITGSVSGWGDEVKIRVIAPDGSTAWSLDTRYTEDGLTHVIQEPVQGTYRMEVDPGQWTGFLHLDIRGVYQGSG